MAERKTAFTLVTENQDKKRQTMKIASNLSLFLDDYYEEEQKPDFNDPANRSRFTTVIFAIITMQMIITTGCTVSFIILPEPKKLVMDNWWVILVFLVILIVPYFMLVCCETTRREFPTNAILLFFLTVGMAGTCACCTVWFETVVICYTSILVIIVTLFIAISASGCPNKIIGWNWILGIMMMFLVVFVTAAVVLGMLTPYPLTTFLYPGIIAAIFCAFLMHDIKTVMSGQRVAHITPHDYIMGATQVYVDVVGVFVTFLEIVGTITEND